MDVGAWGLILAISVALFFMVELEKFASPCLARAFSCCFKNPVDVTHQGHTPVTEGDFKFYATSASIHGIAAAKKASKRANPSEKAGNRFSTQKLNAKAAAVHESTATRSSAEAAGQLFRRKKSGGIQPVSK